MVEPGDKLRAKKADIAGILIVGQEYTVSFAQPQIVHFVECSGYIEFKHLWDYFERVTPKIQRNLPAWW